MIKSPFTSTGEIRYFELFKIFFFLAFLFALLTKLIVHLETTVFMMQSSTTILVVLYIIQGILVLYENIQALYRLIQSFVVRITYQPDVPVITVPVIPYVQEVISVYKEKQYLRYNVIRC